MTDIPEVPNSLKSIKCYIDRGKEIEKVEPVVSYYAIYYAITRALKGSPNKEEEEYISSLLGVLEKRKATFDEHTKTAITEDEVGYQHIEAFAMKIFLRADNQDRTGAASRATAKTFVAASTFLELLNLFGDLDPEVEEKIKYSKWKATDIAKAIREGRTPAAGPPGEKDEPDEIVPETAQQPLPDSHPKTLQQPPPLSDFPSPPGNFTAPPQQGNDMASTPPTVALDTTNVPPASATKSTSTVASSSPQPTAAVPIASPLAQNQVPSSTPAAVSAPRTEYSKEVIARVEKNLRFARSCMDYDDYNGVRNFVTEILKDLQ